MRILGVDYGRARLGLAISDEDATLASPLPQQRRTHSLNHDVRQLARWAREHRIKRIVIGLPLNMNGSRGEMAEEVISFAERVRRATDLPVELTDERLTSVEAERVLVEANLSRKRRKGLRDSLAAVLILQEYLNRECTGASGDQKPV